jgi:hypothetical protein
VLEAMNSAVARSEPGWHLLSLARVRLPTRHGRPQPSRSAPHDGRRWLGVSRTAEVSITLPTADEIRAFVAGPFGDIAEHLERILEPVFLRGVSATQLQPRDDFARRPLALIRSKFLTGLEPALGIEPRTC